MAEQDGEQPEQHEEVEIIEDEAIYTTEICSESSDYDGSNSSSSSVRTILSQLRSPTSSELSRKRRVNKNPPKGKRRSYARGKSDPKNVTPQQRVKKLSNEPLTVSNNKLFCLACREELSVKSSVLNMHIQSRKHNMSKERLSSKEKVEKDIASALEKSKEVDCAKGDTLPTNQRVYRVKVVKAFLRSGVPISKVNGFRDIIIRRKCFAPHRQTTLVRPYTIHIGARTQYNQGRNCPETNFICI